MNHDPSLHIRLHLLESLTAELREEVARRASAAQRTSSRWSAFLMSFFSGLISFSVWIFSSQG